MSKQIRIDENSRVPKYRQIVDAIVNNITKGELEINQNFPPLIVLAKNTYYQGILSKKRTIF